MKTTIRVLIAEDSVFIQKILVKILTSDPAIQVVGVAGNGKMAVDMARALRPDVITMDIRMPVMDGFQATRIIMSEMPTPILVISSSVNDEDLRISFSAIQSGALDIMEKPRGHLSADYLDVGREIVRKLKLIADIKVFHHIGPVPGDRSGLSTTPSSSSRYRGVAIGASTGGPTALFQVLTALGKDLPAPVFVTLHISAGFGRGCVDWINRNAQMDIRMATDCEQVRPGVVYFAPDDRIMRVATRNLIAVDPEPMSRRALPIDVMMETFATAFGPQGIGVLLTGMGDDGAKGMVRLRTIGGRTIAQSEETCVVFGMPREAISRGGADEIQPLDAIAQRLVSLLSE